MPGLWLTQHPRCQLPEDPMIACLESEEYRDWSRNFTGKLIRTFEIDGIIWDEPHSYFCHCPACKDDGIDSEIKAHQLFAARLDELGKFAKQCRPDLTISCFVQPHDDLLLQALIPMQTIDYLGADGHVRSSNHIMHRMKTTIFEAHQKYAPLLREAGKKSFFLLEAQRHRDEDLQNYLDNLNDAFTLSMDQLMYYYSAHEMSPANENKFNAATWKMVRSLKRK